MSQPATVSLVENGIFPDNKRYRYSDSIHLRDPGVVDEPLKQQKVSQFQTISDDGGSDKSTEREPEAGCESSAGPSYSPQKMEQPMMEQSSQENPTIHQTEMAHAMEAPHTVEASHAVETPRAVEAPHTVEAPQAVEMLRPTGEGPSTKEMSGNPPSEASQPSTAPEAPSSPHLRAVEEHSSQSKTTTRSFRDLFRRTANHIRERSSQDIVRPPSRLSYRKGRPSTSTRHAEDFTLPEINEPVERQQRKSLSGANENVSMLSRSSGNSHTSLTFGNLRKLMKVSTGASLLGKSKSGLHPNQDEPLFQIKFPTLNNLKDQLRFSNFGSPTRFGAEPKAKQPMTSDLDYIEVDTLDLMDTFVNASKGLGRRGREIAKGSTATVKVMYRKGTVSVIPYAVKEFRKPKSNVDGHAFATQIKSEFSIANSLHHPNIVETICLCTHAGRWNHVMEYCGQGELFSLVQKDYFKMDDKFCLFKQLLQGVAYLHSNGIAHRDIKLENLLLTDHGHLKITDFGVAVVFRGPHPGLRAVYNETEEHDEIRKCEPGICGSLPYIAPEVLRRDCEYDPRPIDIWSCGIVCLALFFQGTPWQEATRYDPNYLRFLAGWEKFLQENPDGTVDSYNYPSCGRVFNAFPKPPFRRILLQMLQPDPNRRVNIQEVLNDRWVKRIECCCPDPEMMRIAVQYTEADMDESQLTNKLNFKRHNHCPPNKRGFFPRNRSQA